MRKGGRGQGAARRLSRTKRLVDSDSSSSYESTSLDGDSEGDYECPVCSFPESGVDPWIACDTCWFHIH